MPAVAGIARPGGAVRHGRGGARGRPRRAAGPAGDALGQADERAHDLGWAARLGDRARGLPLCGAAPGDGRAVAADPFECA